LISLTCHIFFLICVAYQKSKCVTTLLFRESGTTTSSRRRCLRCALNVPFLRNFTCSQVLVKTTNFKTSSLSSTCVSTLHTSLTLPYDACSSASSNTTLPTLTPQLVFRTACAIALTLPEPWRIPTIVRTYYYVTSFNDLFS
jgi:hypothetical protein